MATFFENLKGILGPNPFIKLDPIAEKRWGQADMEGLNNYVQKEASKTPAQKSEEVRQRSEAATKGTLFLNEDTKNNPVFWEVDPQTNFFNNLQIAQNLDRLNKIVNDYESADGWEQKQKVIKDGYDSFPNKTAELMQWFDNFAKLTSRAADPENDLNNASEEIAETMRYYLNSARDKYFKKA